MHRACRKLGWSSEAAVRVDPVMMSGEPIASAPAEYQHTPSPQPPYGMANHLTAILFPPVVLWATHP